MGAYDLDFPWPPTQWQGVGAPAQPVGAVDPLASPPGYDEAFASVGPWESQPVPDLAGMAADAAKSAATPTPVVPVVAADDPLASPPGYDQAFGNLGWSSPGAPPDLASATAAGAAQVPGRGLELGPPDAVSGVGPVELTPTAPPMDATGALTPTSPAIGSPVAGAPVQPGVEPIGQAPAPADPMAPGVGTPAADPLEPEESMDELAAKYAQLDPVAFAQLQAKQQLKLDNEKATRELELAERDRVELENNVKIRNEARAASQRELADITKSAKEMSDSSPFESWWSSRSTGQQIAGVIAAIFGGFNNLNGPNSAIDTFIKVAESDAAQKWKKLQERRGLVGDAMTAAGNDFADQEAIRLASLQQAKRTIDAQISRLDPKSRGALQLVEVSRGVEGRIAQAEAEAGAALEKNKLEEYKAASDRMKAEADMMRAKTDQAKNAGRGGGGGTGRGGGVPGVVGWGPKDVRPANDWASRFALPPSLVKALPAGNMSGREFDDWFDRQKSIGAMTAAQENEVGNRQKRLMDHQKFVLEHEINDEGEPLYVYESPGQPKLDEFGDPVRIMANTPAEGAALREKIRNTKQAIRLAYEAEDILKQASLGERALPWEQAKQKLAVIKSNLGPLLKAGTEGMSSDTDMDNLVGGIGAKDLQSFVSQGPALRKGIEVAHNLLNGQLRTYHYNGPPIIVKNPYATGPRRNSVSDDVTAKLSGREGSRGSFTDALLPDTSSVGAFLESAIPFRGKPSAKMTEQQADNLTMAKNRVAEGGADAAEFAAGMLSAARSGGNPATRRAVASEFWKLHQSGNPAAVAAYRQLDQGQQALFLSQLPKNEAWKAIRAMNGIEGEDD